MEVRTGDVVGGYRLDEVIGRGPLGVTFKAFRLSDEQAVVVKLFDSRVSRDDVFRDRLETEAQAAMKIRYRYLLPLLDLGEDERGSYVVFEFEEGESLEERLRKPLPLHEALAITARAGMALDKLHQNDLIHRDVKPSNILLASSGRVLLTDYGMAKARAYTILSTRHGGMMGAVDYLAPEIIRGQAARPASDVYALGCVVFECLAGQSPFGGRNAWETALAHLDEEPPDLLTELGVPSTACSIVLKALAKDPRERPPTARVWAVMLHLASQYA